MSAVMFFCFCLWCLSGVFGTESVSVTEGDSVTLSVNVTESQRKEGISWKFGPQEITIAEIEVETNDIRLYDERADGRFRDRLQLNKHTGSLTINNITITDSGDYKVTSTSTNTQIKIFNIIVYAHLSVPIISRVSPQCSSSSERSSSSTCVLLCSVMNVTHVTLSWYKGNSLFSNISASDLNIRLSLPLEVEYQDNNTYSCVVNNPIRNQTQHLNITDVCQCSGLTSDQLVLICSSVAGSLMIVAAVLMFWICRKHRHTHQDDQSGGEEITYAETTFRKRQTHKPGSPVEDEVVYAGVMMR